MSGEVTYIVEQIDVAPVVTAIEAQSERLIEHLVINTTAITNMENLVVMLLGVLIGAVFGLAYVTQWKPGA